MAPNWLETCITVVFHEDFPSSFADWLLDNEHVWLAFEREALRVVAKGFRHYSSQTIIYYLRHHAALAEIGKSGWKLNNNHTAYLSRLWALLHPELAGLFEYRTTRQRAEPDEGDFA